MVERLRRRLIVTFLLLLSLIGSPAWAAVEVSFYAKEFGSSFPHAFVVFTGQTDAGTPVNSDYGFTAKSISPAILMGSVPGEIMSHPPAYIAESEKHFSLVISDHQYEAAMAVVHRWRTRAQPSYNLNRANCVHFVAQIAEAVGLSVKQDPKLMKKPRSFLISVKNANQARLAKRSG